MIFVPGSKTIYIAISIVLISVSILGGIIMTEKKQELTRNKKEWEIVSEKLKQDNMVVIKEIEL